MTQISVWLEKDGIDELLITLGKLIFHYVDIIQLSVVRSSSYLFTYLVFMVQTSYIRNL